jgi:predicted nucleic acid-binding protein
MPAELWLVDSNILIRLLKQDHPSYWPIRRAVTRLKDQGSTLCYTLQNMAEFWNASTRPVDRNGFGMPVEEVDAAARLIERTFAFLPDNEAVYREWRRLVVRHAVSGVQVHDARLAAAMMAHGVTRILTLNGADFRRFGAVTAVHPGELEEKPLP